jgi:hypothetical protein
MRVVIAEMVIGKILPASNHLTAGEATPVAGPSVGFIAVKPYGGEEVGKRPAATPRAIAR